MVVVGAVILTFIITSLSMLVLFFFNESKNQDAEKRRILKENDGLRRQLSDYGVCEQQRRENRAYDRGLYDGRGTDMLYRQCLKKYMNRDQPNVMMNGESEEN